MSSKKIDDIIYEIALPISEKHQFELVDVEFVKEGADWHLRIYIDKDGGINIDDCQIFSHEISDEIDKKDPIPQNYFLEVSSPGLDRVLKKERDFEKYKGDQVEVKVFKSVDNNKIFTGELLGLIDDIIEIKNDKGNIIKFERANVSTVRRLVKI